MGKYHVLSGKVMSADLQPTQHPATVQGAKVAITKGAKVKFADAEVTQADVEASNGVVHVIDKVVLPPTVVDIAKGSADHTVLVEALVKANLVNTLDGTGPFTVFAPTDQAFTNALTALGLTKTQLLDKADLADILKYHVLSGKVMSADLQPTQNPATVQGAKVTITKDGSTVKFAEATVNPADIVASNGVVHVIDKVVLPPAVDGSTTTTTSKVSTKNKQVGGSLQMTVNSAMLNDNAAVAKLKNTVAEVISTKANVAPESVNVEIPSRRLQSGSGGTVSVKLTYTIDVPTGVDASVVTSAVKAIQPQTLTTTVNKALADANISYEITVDSITAAEIIPDVTTTSNEVIDSSISMHGRSRFAVVLVTAAMFWGAS